MLTASQIHLYVKVRSERPHNAQCTAYFRPLCL